MSNRILDTYASRVGSTAGMADLVGKTLAESGGQVDVLPIQAGNDLSPFLAVGAYIQPDEYSFFEIKNMGVWNIRQYFIACFY